MIKNGLVIYQYDTFSPNIRIFQDETKKVEYEIKPGDKVWLAFKKRRNNDVIKQFIVEGTTRIVIPSVDFLDVGEAWIEAGVIFADSGYEKTILQMPVEIRERFKSKGGDLGG